MKINFPFIVVAKNFRKSHLTDTFHIRRNCNAQPLRYITNGESDFPFFRNTKYDTLEGEVG